MKQSVGDIYSAYYLIGNKMIQKVLVSKADKKDKGMKPDKINKLIKKAGGSIFVAVIWQIASVMTGLELLLASPVTVLRTLAGMLVTRQFYGILYLSVMHIMSGMLAGCLIGICAGILSAQFDFLKDVARHCRTVNEITSCCGIYNTCAYVVGYKNVTFIISAMVVIPMITTGVKEALIIQITSR